jgi:hypothetical protein
MKTKLHENSALIRQNRLVFQDIPDPQYAAQRELEAKGTEKLMAINEKKVEGTEKGAQKLLAGLTEAKSKATADKPKDKPKAAARFEKPKFSTPGPTAKGEKQTAVNVESTTAFEGSRVEVAASSVPPVAINKARNAAADLRAKQPEYANDPINVPFTNQATGEQFSIMVPVDPKAPVRVFKKKTG